MIVEFLNTPEFQDWQWQLSVGMRTAIEGVYASNPRQLEIEAIQALVGAGNSHPQIQSPAVPRITVEVESSFLHGPRSQVSFEIGGATFQRELADLLVLGSYIENRMLRWQRVCFIQAKRPHGGSSTSAFRYQIEPLQLALLRGFPPFSGVSGIFQGQRHHLRNRSGMLGAYGFLATPGEFSVSSARVLDHVLGGRGSLAGKELVSAFLSDIGIIQPSTSFYPPWLPLDPDHCPECRHFFERFFDFPWHRSWRHHHPMHTPRRFMLDGDELVNRSILSCMGIDSFVQHWTSLRLGEIWRARVDVASDRALANCIWNLVSHVNRHTNMLPNLLRLLEDARRNPSSNRNNPEFPYLEKEGGSIGVLSAVMKVERGEE